MNAPRVLIVEDNAVEADLLAKILTREDYEIVGTAGTVEEAVELAQSTRPDVVMIDIWLPLVDGGAVDREGGVKAARQILSRGNPSVVFITGGPTTPELVKKAHELGGGFFLVKPVKPEQTLLTTALALVKKQGKKLVFVCYAHKDNAIREEMDQFLRPMSALGIDSWDDTKIRFGQHWRDEIANAVKRANVAIVMVSIDFVNSRFIQEFELPALLEAEKQRGLTVIPVFVRYVPENTLEHCGICEFQGLNSPEDTLDRWTEQKRATDAWGRLCKQIG